MWYGLLKAILDSLLGWFKPDARSKATDADEKPDQMRATGLRLRRYELQQDGVSKRVVPDSYGSSVSNEDLHPPTG